MSAFPACIELGTVLRDLPNHYRDLGIIAQINVAYRYRYANQLWRKSEAVRLAVEARMDSAAGSGKGMKAGRRAARLKSLREAEMALADEMAAQSGLTVEDVDALAEIFTEGRTYSRQFKTNYHE